MVGNRFRALARSLLIFGAIGPLLASAAAGMLTVVLELASGHAPFTLLAAEAVGWIAIIPFGYLLGFMPAIMSGAIAASLLLASRKRLYVSAATMLNGLLCWLLIPPALNGLGARNVGVGIDSSVLLVGVGAFCGLGSALISIRLTKRLVGSLAE